MGSGKIRSNVGMIDRRPSRGGLVKTTSAPVRTANYATAPRGLNRASRFLTAACWIASPDFSGTAMRISHCNRWSGAKHWQRSPRLTAKAREGPGGCQRSTNWNRSWIAPPTARPCRQGIHLPTCRTFTGPLPPACSSLIGPGPCTWKRARRGLDRSGSHDFPY